MDTLADTVEYEFKFNYCVNLSRNVQYGVAANDSFDLRTAS